MMRVSVVIPMYNATSIILKCLTALALQERLPDEVILVDNNSTDDSVAVVNNATEIVKALNVIICHECKKGPSAARNKGVHIATGDIIAFIDSDCIAHPTWAKNIIATFEKEPDLHVVSGINKAFNDGLTVMEKFLCAFWVTSDMSRMKHISHKEAFFDDDFIGTFNCAFKKDFLVLIGGFNEDYITGEDMDITFRSIDANGKILIWSNDVMVYHEQSITLRNLIKKVFFYGEGLAHLMRMHFPHHVIIRLPWRNFIWKFKQGPTILLMRNLPKMLVLMFSVLLTWQLSWVLGVALILIVTLYFINKIHTLINAVGVPISYRESLQAFVFYIFREIAELFGRFYWSFKYKVVCL